jgi:hypothetical protein
MELIDEDKPIKICIVGLEIRAEHILAVLQRQGHRVELITEDERDELQGLEYDSVYLDDLAQLAPPSLSLPASGERRSRGKGKKYKDWDRRF